MPAQEDTRVIVSRKRSFRFTSVFALAVPLCAATHSRRCQIDAQHAYIFVWPEKDSLKRNEWKGPQFDRTLQPGSALAPPNIDDQHNGMPGGMLSVNVDPTGPSLGIVLASVRICGELGYPQCAASQDFGVLRAYDPFTMQEVSSNQCEGKKYWFAKFVPATVAGGRIFLPTGPGKVLIYGQ